MPGHHFKFAISTLSCAPVNIFQPHTILIPAYATKETVKRFLNIKKTLENTMNDTTITASLHMGYMIHTPYALELLERHNVLISSLDTPDVRSIPECFIELSKNVLYHTSIQKVKNTLGWQLASVSSQQQYRDKVMEAMVGLTTQDSVHMIRTSTGSWHHSTVGKQLMELIAHRRTKIQSLAIAVEIDARHQTPLEYAELVYMLNKNNYGIPVYFDLDVGHIAESRNRHKRKWIEKPEVVVEWLLSQKKYRSLIGMISLNQYDHERDETHISLLKGSIDYLEILRMMGQATRANIFVTEPYVLAEFSPFAYDDMISPEGMRYFRLLRKAYYSSN